MPEPAPSKKAKAKKEEVARPLESAQGTTSPALSTGAPEATATSTTAAAIEAPTYDETAKALIAVGAKFGRDKVMDILAPFDSARSLKQVDPSDYAAVVAACELALS